MKFLAILLILFISIAQTAWSQANFEAISKEEQAKYHFDFARNFFPTPDAEKNSRPELYSVLSNLEKLQGKVGSSAANLFNALQLYDQAQVLFLKHDTYLYLSYVVNTKDQNFSHEESNLSSEFTKRTAFIQTECTQISQQKLVSFIKEEPRLQPYRFFLESFSRYAPYTLSLKEEELLAATAPSSTEWQFDLYQNTIDATKFGTVQTKDGEMDVRTQRAAIAASAERRIREEAFHKLYQGYSEQRQIYAFALTQLAQARDTLAKIKNYEDASAEVYFNSYWTKQEVQNLLQRIAQSAQVYKKYQQLRADSIRKTLAYPDTAYWDISVGQSSDKLPRFTIEQATKAIREALSPLGVEYSKELNALLDPSNGRMDIVSGQNRKSGGFSKGFPGVTTVFYSSRFDGYYNDLRILTHESTHAIHRQLMKDNNVLPANANGPSYLFESFAIFNELLLPDYLYQTETDPAKKQYYLQQFFDGKGMALFFVAQDAMLEQAIHDGVRNGSIHDADDLDREAGKIISIFSIYAGKNPELKMRWITDSLFYEDPFYEINYVYGSLLALKYYDLFQKNRNDFVPRYINLMKNGFNDSPRVLLKKFLGIDQNDPRLLTDAIRILNEKMKLIE